MTLVTIPDHVPLITEKAIRAHLKHLALHNSDWNGATFRVKRGDFLSIDKCDQIEGAKLHSDLIRVIEETAL